MYLSPSPSDFRAAYNVKPTSADLDEEELPFSPDEHKKRYKLLESIYFQAVVVGLWGK